LAPPSHRFLTRSQRRLDCVGRILIGVPEQVVSVAAGEALPMRRLTVKASVFAAIKAETWLCRLVRWSSQFLGRSIPSHRTSKKPGVAFPARFLTAESLKAHWKSIQ
jgi:hypothetical protein